MVHHPTVIAAHGEGAHWSFAGDAEVRSKFWGRSIELTPVGLIRLKFDDGDEYNWAKVSAMFSTFAHACYRVLPQLNSVAFAFCSSLPLGRRPCPYACLCMLASAVHHF